MKNLIVFMSLVLFTNTAFSEGILTITPEKVRSGDSVTLNYQPDERFTGLNQAKAFIYGFTDKASNPYGYETILLKSDNHFSGKFHVPDSIHYAIIQIYGEKGDESFTDDNYSDYWDFIIYSADGKPIKNANLKASLSYMGALPENIDRNVDFDKSHNFMLNEIANYPDNMTAKIGLSSLELDMKKINQDEYKSKITNYLDSKFDFTNENEVRAVSRALKTLNATDKAEELERKYASENSNSELAEELVLQFLAAAESRKEFTEIALQFLRFYPYSSNWQNVYSALISAYLQNADYKRLIEIVSAFEVVPANIYSQIAWELASNQQIIEKHGKEVIHNDAINIYQKALFAADSSTLPFGYKSRFLTPTEWSNKVVELRAMLAETGGRLYLLKENQQLAKDYFTQALNLYNDAPVSLYENLISIYIDNDEKQKAFDLAGQAVINSKFSDNIARFHQEIFKELNKDTLYNYDSYIDSLSTIAKEKRLAHLRYDMINEGPFYGVFETLDGRFIDAEEMRGKIVVLAFWSTWCGPCQVLLPSFDVFNKDYQESEDVIIAAVNLWDYEKDKDDIIAYLQELGVDFMAYIDKTDLIARKAGLTGLPVTIFIDREGMIQFKETGFSNENDYIRMADDRIDLLNQK